ncbi:MAG: TM0996/MTH895 family glutaredoxin-like protein [Candidatus Delongbacteria bacterium]|nr:TM0996/MTH895 family glutaredoxin-like protein [Candidatus Delongbacteria bacterium]
MPVIKILGSGCPKCKKLAENTEKALQELKMDQAIVKVTDITEIMDYGVMMTPALVFDHEVKSSGKVLSTDEIKKLLSSIQS